jgi:hypothetical protein
MRKLLYTGAFILLTLFALAPNNSVYATGLKVAPLEFKTSLAKGEKKKGYIDISNPSGESISIQTSVQAFRQINNDGGLQFYDDAATASGIRTDLTNFTLGPREALRMYFLIDGNKLPHGDTYAAIFFKTTLKKLRTGVGQLVRVGSLLSIVNQTPGDRKAKITGVDIPFLQLSDTIEGSYDIKNTGKTSGFYPEVTISAWPGNSRKQTSSLVFAGRERENQFTYPSGVGLHRIEVRYGESSKSMWVVTITPFTIVMILFILLVVGTEFMLHRRRQKTTKKPGPTSEK